MNLYSRKQAWKIALFAFALLIVGSSFLYTNSLVKDIRQEERQKVGLWAEAVQNRARLVNYTKVLFDTLNKEEKRSVELWAEATKRLANSDNESDISFILMVVHHNYTVPVILADENDQIISYRNLDPEKAKNKEWLLNEMEEMRDFHEPIQVRLDDYKKHYLYYKDSKLFAELKTVLDHWIESFISETMHNTASVPVVITDSTQRRIIHVGNLDSSLMADSVRLFEELEAMRKQNKPIRVVLNDEVNYIFYEDTLLLKKLTYFPIVQFLLVGIFIFIAYVLFSITRKAEQNQVWIGMAKETAHQLGTPLSSLMAWLDLFKMQSLDDATIAEIDKDLNRLNTIAERFSKIGSEPKLKEENLNAVIEDVVEYIRARTSSKVIYNVESNKDPIPAQINAPLFEWVIENLLRNAVDAMGGEGDIYITIEDTKDTIIVDLRDTGKGLPSSKFKTVFQPGFTTKKRGWGLGLSLAKRIIQDYHRGKIFVKFSEIDVGTTFRIILKK